MSKYDTYSSLEIPFPAVFEYIEGTAMRDIMKKPIPIHFTNMKYNIVSYSVLANFLHTGAPMY